MSVKQLNKSNYLAFPNLSSTQVLLKAAIAKVESNYSITINPSFSAFLINPSTWEDSKTANWVQNNIPGQSDPILQWVSGGPRTLAFEALVTQDTARISRPNSNSNASTSSSSFSLGRLANQLWGTAINTAKNLLPITPRSSQLSENDKNQITLDISDQLNFYRSLLYPQYDSIVAPSKVVNSPPLVILIVGDSFAWGTGKSNNKKALMSSMTGEQLDVNNTYWALTNLRIKITKQLPNLSPMEAVVEFNLVQYIRASVGSDLVLSSYIKS
jgi:hypothetical protein